MVSADQHHMTVLQLRCQLIEVRCIFFRFSAYRYYLLIDHRLKFVFVS